MNYLTILKKIIEEIELESSNKGINSELNQFKLSNNSCYKETIGSHKKGMTFNEILNDSNLLHTEYCDCNKCVPEDDEDIFIKLNEI